MNYAFWLQLFVLALTVGVLITLIVLLTRNPDTNDPQQINNKVNGLYIIEIISVSLMVLFAIISAVMYYRYK